MNNQQELIEGDSARRGSSLAVANNQNHLTTIVQPPPIAETMETAKILADSGFFKDCKSAAQACAKVLAGQELGIGPMASISQIYIIEGKATMDATLVGAQIKKSGRYDYRVRTSTDQECVLEFFERGQSVGESSFTLKDAERANLTSRATWKNYPKAMLRSRAMTQGARMFCPDVFNGAIYAPDEVMGPLDTEPFGGGPGQRTPELKSVGGESVVDDERAAEKAERETLVRNAYAILKISTTGLKGNDPMHREAMDQVAHAMNLPAAPARWSDFAIEDLRGFVAGDYAVAA